MYLGLKELLALINYCQVKGWNWLKISFVFLGGGDEGTKMVGALIRNININILRVISRIDQALKQIGLYLTC